MAALFRRYVQADGNLTRNSVLILGFITLAAGAALGADFSDDDYARAFGPLDESEAGLKFTFTPGLWMPRLAGDAQFAPGGRLELRHGLTMRNSEPTFNAEFAIRRHERWELHFSGFHFATEARSAAESAMTFGAVSLAPGDVFRSEFEMTSISAELRVSAFRPLPLPWNDGGESNATPDGKPIADLRLKPTFGARWVQVHHDVTDLGPAMTAERVRGEWAIPYAGITLELACRPEGVPLTDHFRIEAGVGFGPALGSGSGYGWHVRAGVAWHFTPNIGVNVGYRLVDLNVKKDDYQLRGGLQGLFAAGSIRF
jgi:hypothetical protein